MKNSKAEILVVEDDPAILSGLLDVLVFNGFAVKGLDDGIEGLTAGLKERYDLIILDVMLPGMDGFTICRKIRQKKPSQGIIILTAKGAEDDLVKGFKAGADDYISKPFSLKELMVRVEAVLRRSGLSLGDEQIINDGVFFDGKLLKAVFQEQKVDLTRKEMDIITYLHQNQDRIISKNELLTEVWHYANADIETRTVDIHLLKLRKKIISLKQDLRFIKTIRGQGYLWEKD